MSKFLNNYVRVVMLGTSLAEQEANYFAMCLLMPEEMLIPDFKKIKAWKKGKKFLIEKLANMYHVTYQIMNIRLSNLGLIKNDNKSTI